MIKKLVTCLATGAIVFGVTGYAMAATYSADNVVNMNVPNLEYYFTFKTLETPKALKGDPLLKPGTLFLQHDDGDFSLTDQSVGVYIDDVYYGSLFNVSNSDADLEEIMLDWHQMNSITSDGTATVRVVNSSDVGTAQMTEYGTMEAWLTYEGTGSLGTGSAPTPYDGHQTNFLTDDVVDINHPIKEYVFQFDDLIDPAYMREGLLEQPLGGVLFLQHTDGDFSLDTQSIGVYIDDIYFGPLFNKSNSNGDLEEIILDWHQLYSITEDGEATVRIVNSSDVGTAQMTEYGTMSAWLSYHTIPEPATMLLFGLGLLGLAGVSRKKQ